MQTSIRELILDQSVAVIEAHITMREAARLMGQRQISALFVPGPDGVAGVITERDVTRMVANGRDPERTRVVDVMTKDPVTVAPEQAPIEALRLMRDRNFRHLPVVDQGQLIGVLSIRDLLLLVEETVTSAAA